MKRCPECRRDYYDETLLYCLDDGTALLDGPASLDGTPTAILHSTAPPGDVETRAQILTTDQTLNLPSATGDYGRRFDRRLLAIPGLILVAAAAFGIYKYGPFGGSGKTDLSLANAKITRLTTSGKATQVAISPDGKYVVHVQDDGGQQSLFIRQVATQSNVQIVPPAPVQYSGIQFSHSGDHIYYSVYSPIDFSKVALFKLPTLGGQPQKIKEGLNAGRFSFSPDGGRFVFVRNIEETTFQMFIANADGTGEQMVMETKTPNLLDNIAWSPDGERIVFEDFNASTGSRLSEMRLADRSTRQISDKVWCCGMGNLNWTRDGTGLFFWASDRQGPGQIWQLSYPGGEPRQLTNDPEGVGGSVSVTADSSTIAAVKSLTAARIWIGPADAPASAQPVTSGSGKFDTSAVWVPDGRLVFSSSAGGNSAIWSMNADGSNLKQLTSDADRTGTPIVSSDGSVIAYWSGRGYEQHLWIMNADGSEPRRLTSIEGYIADIPTSFSPDGKWIFFNRWGVIDVFAWKIAADGTGEAINLFNKISGNTQVSPDGKLIAYFYKDDAKSPSIRAVASIDGGEPLKTFPICTTCGNMRWSPDGRSLVYTETSPNGVGNLMSQPIAGGEPKKLTDFKSDTIFSLSHSRDGKQIALSRGTTASDVLLFTNIK